MKKLIMSAVVVGFVCATVLAHAEESAVEVAGHFSLDHRCALP